MKKVFVLVLITLAFYGYGQDGNTGSVDRIEKISPFGIDVPFDKLEKFLTGEPVVDPEGYGYLSFKVDLKKVAFSDFFGLKIQEMTVEFDGTYDEEGRPEELDVYAYNIRLDLPENDESASDFMDALVEAFGEFSYLTDPSGEEFVYFQWWTEITLLSVHFGVDEETGQALPYYEVRCVQAYGG